MHSCIIRITFMILNKKGTALLMTILILNSVLVVSLAAAKLILSGVRMSGTQARSTKAYFAGESGAERVLWEFRKNGLYSGGLPGSDSVVFSDTAMPNESIYKVDYTNPGTVKFISTGSYRGVKRSVEVEFDF